MSVLHRVKAFVRGLPLSRRILLVFLAMVAIALPVWASIDSSAWDLRVYGQALESLKAGHDPYSDAMTIQRQHHADLLAHHQTTGNDAAPPYSYVYSPITLPVLGLFAHVPLTLAIAGYWTMYVVFALAAIAVGVSFSYRSERTFALYAAGLAAFFPSLLVNGTVLSGNVAYILYGCVLLCAVLGWKRGVWSPFYGMVLVASCIKAPLLSLALIPALSARRQWLPTLTTMAAGLVLFGSQILLWPSLFRHYLQAVELQFSFNQDFGCSPAGLFSEALSRHGLPYSPACYFFYAAYAIPIFAALLHLSRVYLRGGFTLRQWAPVMVVGVILLNPRIMEYDVAPITVPLALIGWRAIRNTAHPNAMAAGGAVLLVLMNAASLYSWEWRKEMNGPLLLCLLLAGTWNLLRAEQAYPQTELEPGSKTLLA